MSFLEIVLVFVVLLLSLIMTRVMITVGPKFGLVDTPGERRIHTKVIPRCGGLAVWISFFVGIGLLSLIGSDLTGDLGPRWFMSFGVAATGLMIVGLIDDRWELKSWMKLGGQVAVAVAFFFMRGEGVGELLGHRVPVIVDLVVWVVWAIGLINAFNLIDGLDGLCGGLAVISIGSLAFLAFLFGRGFDGVVMLIFIASLLGFLRYNMHPAKIFLGDAGSMFIGLFIASAAASSVGERAVVVSLLLPLLVAGVPFFDVLLAVWRRASRKWVSKSKDGQEAGIFDADKDHLHHRLLAKGMSQRRVAGLLYGLAFVGVLIALLPSILDERAIGLVICLVFVGALLGLRHLAPIELKASGELLNVVLKKPAKPRLIAGLYFSYDLIVLLLAQALAFTAEESGRFRWVDGHHTLTYFIVTLVTGLICLHLSRAQARLWSRSSLRDFMTLLIWYGVSVQISFTVMSFVDRDLAWKSARIFAYSPAFDKHAD